MRKISVALATYNEASNIARCLDAVVDWVDEIVVVDGDSSDETQEIARRYTKKVKVTTNKPNFHINKQQAMDATTGDIILQLDADEVVDDDLRKWILDLAQEQKPLKDAAWWIARKNLFLGRWLSKGGQYPDPVIRLYVQGKAKLPQRDVHEQMQVNGTIGWAKGHLLHYSNPSFADYMRKFNTYTSFTAQQWFEQGKRAHWSKGFWYGGILPAWVFVKLFIRHRGYVDGYPGFVFALMSGLHWSVAYLKLWELQQQS